MSFKSRDLTMKLSGPGEGNCGGCTSTNPDCGGCTNTKPGCPGCSVQTNVDVPCTDTATTSPTGKAQSAMEGAYGAGLAMLRQQLQEAMGAIS